MGAISAFWRFMSLLIPLFALLGTYVWWRASSSFRLPTRVRWLLAALMLTGLACSLGSRQLTIEHQAIAQWLGGFGAAVVMSVLMSATLSLPAELLRGALRLTEPSPAPAQRDRALRLDPERRAFLAQVASGSAIAIGTGAAVYGTVFGRRDYSIETVPIELAKLPRTLDGFTIVQLSDLHVGTFIGERELAAALSLVREAKPDLIALTGDLLDHDPAYAATLGRFARSLSSLARYGVFAAPGNHDYYAGFDEVAQALRLGGVTMLRDRGVRIGDAAGSFVLAGVDDLSSWNYGRAGPRPLVAFEGAGEERARVLLSHNPAAWDELSTHTDLTLSGHTHGGQISLFVNPAKLVLRHGHVRGHYTSQGSQLYVNRGFGTTGPATRVGSPPEVTRLVLTRG